MKKIIILFTIVAAAVSCRSAAEKSASALASRVVPEWAGKISFREVEGSGDSFTLTSTGKKLLIQGGNAVSLTTGLGFYLRNVAGVDVSWDADDPVELPARMLHPEREIKVSSAVPMRYFLNYCTFGYSMPWWKWREWERLIDWMALNGVNMPLAITGQEAIWQKLWMKRGLTDDEVRSFFTGPAHLPWNRMSNIDGVDGPLPQSWIDGQVELQKKILERERALGMTPVLPAFAGHVPARFKELHPEAAIYDIPSWAGFPAENLCHFLSPSDTLFAQIQRDFLQEQTRLFGTGHIYALDLFNEVPAPSWEPEDLAAYSRDAYESMSAVDPEARWLQAGWLFHHDRTHWTAENVKAYLEAVPQGKVIILDYYMEHTPVWTISNKFHGQPYILCYLGNFGGNTRISGPFATVSRRFSEALADGGPNMLGTGCTLEGFGVNRFMSEYALGRAWDSGMSDKEWVRNLAFSHLGRRSPIAEKAWQTLVDSVYVHGAISECPLFCSRPVPELWYSWPVVSKTFYNKEILSDVWKQLLSEGAPTASARYDIVNIGIQVLGNHFETLRNRFTAAVRSGDGPLAETIGDRMKSLLADAETLAAAEPQFSYKRWITQASAWGNNADEAAYMRRNARHIVSTWGTHGLLDYASRFWAGLSSAYYARRWRLYIDSVIMGSELDAIHASLEELENAFVESDNPPVEVAAPQDVCAFCAQLIEKYSL